MWYDLRGYSKTGGKGNWAELSWVILCFYHRAQFLCYSLPHLGLVSAQRSLVIPFQGLGEVGTGMTAQRGPSTLWANAPPLCTSCPSTSKPYHLPHSWPLLRALQSAHHVLTHCGHPRNAGWVPRYSHSSCSTLIPPLLNRDLLITPALFHPVQIQPKGTGRISIQRTSPSCTSTFPSLG